MYPNKEFMKNVYNSDNCAKLHFTSNDRVVTIVGDLYAIKLIMKTRELFWLEYPVNWNEE